MIVVPLIVTAQLASAATVETLGNATISRDDSARTWILGAGGARLTVSINSGSDYQVLSLESPTGRNWLPNAATDTWVVINGKAEAFGRRDAGFQFEGVGTENTGHLLRLDASFRYRPANVRVVRHIAIADGSPTFEHWTTFEPLGSNAVLSDLNGIEIKVHEGTVRWLNGLQGDNSDVARATAFSLQSGRLRPGEGLALGAQGRSSEETVPWFAIDGEDDEFYAGLLWSGAWTLNLFRADDALSVSFGLTNMTTQLGDRPVEGPHVVFGVAAGGLPRGLIGPARLPGAGDSRRTRVLSAGDLQHLVRRRHTHRRPVGQGRDEPGGGARDRALRARRGLVRRRGRPERIRLPLGARALAPGSGSFSVGSQGAHGVRARVGDEVRRLG